MSRPAEFIRAADSRRIVEAMAYQHRLHLERTKTSAWGAGFALGVVVGFLGALALVFAIYVISRGFA